MKATPDVPSDLALGLAPEYDVLGELGRGGSSIVYLGRDRVLGRAVAIKIIRDSFLDDGETTARFEREAQMLGRLQHPNIVTLYGARRLAGGSLALVMQNGEWHTLKAAIREEGALPFARVEQVLRDIGHALAYLHRHDVIHRDIKPENIFIDRESGRALLSDFGIARFGDGHSSVTLTGAVIGTPAYMAPEQIDGADATYQSDLYSLGMVGYEMVTGVRPWHGESLYGVIHKQKTERLPALAGQRPGVPGPLRWAIERAIEKEPAARWPSADALVAHLEGRTYVPPAANRVAAPRALRAGGAEDETPTVIVPWPATRKAASAAPPPGVVTPPPAPRPENGAAASPTPTPAPRLENVVAAPPTVAQAPGLENVVAASPGAAPAPEPPREEPVPEPEISALSVFADPELAGFAQPTSDHSLEERQVAPLLRPRPRRALVAAGAVILCLGGAGAVLAAINAGERPPSAALGTVADVAQSGQFDGTSSNAAADASTGELPAGSNLAGAVGGAATGPVAAGTTLDPAAAVTGGGAGAAGGQGGAGATPPVNRTPAPAGNTQRTSAPSREVPAPLNISAPAVVASGPSADPALSSVGIADLPTPPAPSGAVSAERLPPAPLVPPELRDPADLSRVLRAMPATELRGLQGASGTVLVSVLVNEEGRVDTSRIKVSSGVVRLDNALLHAISLLRFEPATRLGRAESTWVDIPIYLDGRE